MRTPYALLRTPYPSDKFLSTRQGDSDIVEASNAARPGWATTAWGLAGTARGASDRGLSTGRIVQAGIELADEEGLAGLSIRKLAQRLNAGTMATYRHIESKDELVILMVDEALGEPPTKLRSSEGLRAGLTAWASGMSRRYGAHPWLLDAPIVGLPSTPNRALWLEYLLTPLADTGLGLQQMLDAALLIDGHARNVAYLVREIAKASVGESRDAGTWLAPLLDPNTFPVLSRVMASGALEDDTEQNLDFGLERIIAGIEEFIRSEVPSA
ncbi:TetR/AcrR family transcriptional regulator [Glaciihabitans sp. UYNi722]|uniref:TetR/AcrR family transcriptional regulator n=1 Tax=Glaciihabitans sp. UYNi722 TaxID=3156344 RepID=UPI00339572A1